MKHAILALSLLALAGAAHAQDGHHGHHGGHAMAPMTITTSIADGATLATAPTSVRITFEPAMKLTSAKLTTATGEAVPVRFTSPAPTKSVDVTFEALAADRYTLTFVADAGDHEMPGRVRFTVK